MNAFSSCEVVDLSAWRTTIPAAKPNRDDELITHSLTLTREAWREMTVDSEAKVVAERVAVIEARRAEDEKNAQEAEKNARYHEATLMQLRQVPL